MAEPLTDDDLISILRKEEAAAKSYQDGTLSPVREEATNYYDRMPYGDEQEGASQIVTSEFADVIESMMPSLMEVFTGGDKVVEFAPSASEQEQFAQEATDYTGHCFMQRNNGFVLLHAAIKDALMHRLGGLTVDLEDSEEVRTAPVQGVTQAAVDLMTIEAKEKGVELVAELTPDPVDPMAPQPTLSGTITATRKKKKVVVESIAPEDILFSPTARDQDKCSFLGYLKKTTASELAKMGLDEDAILDLRSERPESPEESQRTDSASFGTPDRDQDGDSERQLWLVVGYLRADANGDGVSEMLRVVYAHAGGQKGGRLIEKTEWDGPAAIALASPILVPHAIVGRSMFDQTKDLQQIGSVLTRGMLDNLYILNRPRPVISDQVILDSLLDWVPGSPIRLKAGARPNDRHVEWLNVPDVGPSALNALEYMATVRENRTGTSRNNQGLNADSLNKTARGMTMLMSAAAQRQKLIARVLAETFVARVYRLIYRAIKKAATGPEEYWAGDTFKQVDPTKWPDDMDMTINVGSSAGNAQQEIEQLMFLGKAQAELVTMQGGTGGPFVTPDNIANLTQKLSEKLGYKTPGMFFQPAEKVMQAAQNTPPKPDPKMMEVQAKIQGAQAEFQAEQQMAQARLQVETQQKQQQAAIDVQLQREASAAKLQAQREEAALTLQLKREEATLNAQLKREEMQLEAELEAWKVKNMPKPGNTELQQREIS